MLSCASAAWAGTWAEFRVAFLARPSGAAVRDAAIGRVQLQVTQEIGSRPYNNYAFGVYRYAVGKNSCFTHQSCITQTAILTPSSES